MSAVRIRRGFDSVCLLDIIREDDSRDGSLGLCDAQRPIDQMARLLRRGADLHEIARHILEERKQVDFLLKMAAERERAPV